MADPSLQNVVAYERDLHRGTRTNRPFASLLSDLGFPDGVPSGAVDFEEATSSMANRKSVAHTNGWTVICDPMFFVCLDAVEAEDTPMQTAPWSASLDATLRTKSPTSAQNEHQAQKQKDFREALDKLFQGQPPKN